MSVLDTQESLIEWYMLKPEADIFTDIILEYGIKGIIAQDVLDSEDYDNLSEDTTLGFVFAYKTESLESQNDSVEDMDAASIIFIRQTMDNSCATLSLLNIIFNIDDYRNDFTQGFIDHIEGMNADERGDSFIAAKAFRIIHNSYDIMENQAKAALKESVNAPESDTYNETPYHYKSYLVRDNVLWELDNQKGYPIKLHSICTSNDKNRESWLPILKDILHNKIETGSLESKLIAITKDPIILKENELERTYSDIRGLETKLMRIESRLFNPKTSKNLRMSDLSKDGQQTLRLKKKLEKNSQKMVEEIKQLKRECLIEEANMSRRKFDYAPFISQTLDFLNKKELVLDKMSPSDVDSFNVDTTEDAPTLSQDNNKKATYLSLTEKKPTKVSSSSKNVKRKREDDPNFVKRLLPKRKCTEKAVYSIKKISAIPSAESITKQRKPKTKRTITPREPSKRLLAKKMKNEENQQETSFKHSNNKK